MELTDKKMLSLLRELIMKKGFDPALMDEPFFKELFDAFYEEDKVYTRKEVEDFLKKFWYLGIDSGRVCFAMYDRRFPKEEHPKQEFEKPSEYNTINKVVSSTIKSGHLQSQHYKKEDKKRQEESNGKKNNRIVLFAIAFLFCVWMGCMYLAATYGNAEALHYGCLGGSGVFTGILVSIVRKWRD